MEAIHTYAREGEAHNLIKCIDNGVPVNLRGLFPVFAHSVESLSCLRSSSKLHLFIIKKNCEVNPNNVSRYRSLVSISI